jgi:hypothetical protein
VAGAPAPPARLQAGQSGALDLLFEQGKRLFDQFNYDEAVKIFNQLINAMTVAGQTPRQDLLVQTYELRARSRFALGETAGAEQDFAALLGVKPDFKLGSGHFAARRRDLRGRAQDHRRAGVAAGHAGR